MIFPCEVVFVAPSHRVLCLIASVLLCFLRSPTSTTPTYWRLKFKSSSNNSYQLQCHLAASCRLCQPLAIYPTSGQAVDHRSLDPSSPIRCWSRSSLVVCQASNRRASVHNPLILYQRASPSHRSSITSRSPCIHNQRQTTRDLLRRP